MIYSAPQPGAFGKLFQLSKEPVTLFIQFRINFRVFS